MEVFGRVCMYVSINQVVGLPNVVVPKSPI